MAHASSPGAAAGDAIDAALRERFGLERFRPGQREVIEQTLAGRDVLCVMPTGGGKSLCYQLPALLLDGFTLVVSPLIALMKDQVDALAARGISAALINSTLDPAEQADRIRGLEAGRYKIVYVAPERFRSSRFQETMRRAKPSLLAVDEAHCISEWGHDFRPDYTKLGPARIAMGGPPCIALTATATDQVRADIAGQLGLATPKIFVTGFDRPNLAYSVLATGGDDAKHALWEKLFNSQPGAAIIYASSRAKCETIAAELASRLKLRAVVYHAGLSKEERHKAQELFMSGAVSAVVATNAFGMGVDKPDIRSVIHFNMPGTLEAYYQEAGRAGRDGKPAQCVLMHAYADRRIQEYFIENAYPDPYVIEAVYDLLRQERTDPIELTQMEIKDRLNLKIGEQAVGSALKILESAAAIERFRPWENKAIVRLNIDADEGSLVDRLSDRADTRRRTLLAIEAIVGGRLGEPVYFRPDDAADRAGVDRAAFNRAMSRLAAELPLDYVPPFRGNAIRVIQPKKSARDLAIDYAQLETRKSEEYKKLDLMAGFANTRKCRRGYLLSYFGEHSAQAAKCRACDNCGIDMGVSPAQSAPERTAVKLDAEGPRQVVLKTLSGVARTTGRVGKSAVVRMLFGSSDARIAKLGLDRLSTFGILKDQGLTRDEVSAILRACEEAGLVETIGDDPQRPRITLASPGWEFVKGKTETAIELNLSAELARKLSARSIPDPTHPAAPAENAPAPKEIAPAPKEIAPAPDENVPAPSLHDVLVRWRAERARSLGERPEALISNAALAELVKQAPRTPAELARMPALKGAERERFGGEILALLSDRPGASESPAAEEIEAPAQEAAAPAPAAAPREPALGSPDAVPTQEWTRRLLELGFPAREIAAIRNLALEEIVAHACVLARKGQAVALEPFLPDHEIKRWRKVIAQRDGPPPADWPHGEGLWRLAKLIASRRL